MYIYLLFLRLRDFPRYGTFTAKKLTVLGTQASWSPPVASHRHPSKFPSPLFLTLKEVRASQAEVLQDTIQIWGISHLKHHKEGASNVFEGILEKGVFSD